MNKHTSARVHTMLQALELLVHFFMSEIHLLNPSLSPLCAKARTHKLVRTHEQSHTRTVALEALKLLLHGFLGEFSSLLSESNGR